MIFKCEECRGLGWICFEPGNVWPVSCKACGGHARFTVNELAHLIQEDPLTLKNLLEMKRTHFATARRIFSKLIARWPQRRGRFVF